ncbi:MAG TPA: hypothetical protein VKM93_00075 [Terriglobia bacterium]|nr:hypothetical protein [Terriglobia bacterium]
MNVPTTAHDNELRLTMGRLVAIAGAMWIAFLGVDFLFSAGLLSRYYVNPGPVFLPPALMFRRIPFGYGSFLLLTALLLWLERHLGIRGAAAGARFGAAFGLVFAVAGNIGLFSMFPLGGDMLAAWAACEWAEFTVAGGIGGAGLAQAPATRLYAVAGGILIGGFLVAAVMQNAGLAVATRR